jgi:hypothetical protein
MPHRRSASARRDQFLDTVECEFTIPSGVRSGQGSVLRARKAACRSSESVGSLLALWLIKPWGEPS